MTHIIVVLAEDDIIDGKLYVAGQRVRVPADYSNVKRVVGKAEDIKEQNQRRKRDVLWPRLIKRLQQLPAWGRLPDRRKQELLDKIRANPELLDKAVKNPNELLRGEKPEKPDKPDKKDKAVKRGR